MTKPLKTQKLPPLPDHPFTSLPHLFSFPPCQTPPTDGDCYALWDKHHMYPNIRRHSLLVAHIAQCMATRAREMGIAVQIQTARASGLLHDLAKTWCLQHGGGHETLGAAWVMQETGNFEIAQSVLFHIYWPWDFPQGREICQVPFFIQYADKRVMHDKCVTLEQRYKDLIVRYGKTPLVRAGIRKSYSLSLLMEQRLSQALGKDLHEDTFDSGWLVP